MKTSTTLVRLSLAIALFALAAAGAGLFWQDEGSHFIFTTLHGQQVQIYGQGLYRYDTPISAIGFMMADVVTLVLAIPLSVIALLRYRHGSLRGGILLAGVLAYFLYNYSSVALGGAYNNFFLLYVALLAFDIAALPGHFSAALPRRGIGIYLIVSGVILLLIWLVRSIIPALL